MERSASDGAEPGASETALPAIARNNTVHSTAAFQEWMQEQSSDAFHRNREQVLKGQVELERRVLASAYERDRPRKEVAPPAWHQMRLTELFDVQTGAVDCDALREHLRAEGRLTMGAAAALLERATAALRLEPNVVNVVPPVLVFGDIHGQFYDLLNMMQQAGAPGEVQYLFLGDYVDRGLFSIEVLFYLYALKLRYPQHVWLLRGNHESQAVTELYNFRTECLKKYNERIYQLAIASFRALPLAATATIDKGRMLFVHGGISPHLPTLESMRCVDRFAEPGKEGALCDVLWADPIDERTGNDLDEEDMLEWYDVGFVPNPDRGCSYVFGHRALQTFLDANELVCVVRAHEVKKDGFQEQWFHRQGQRPMPMLMTVFSAPNYADMYENQAAWLELHYDRYEFHQTDWVEHPYWLAKFRDGFQYSLPWVAENIIDFCETIWRVLLPESDEQWTAEEQADYKRIRAKIMALAALRQTLHKAKQQELEEQRQRAAKHDVHDFDMVKAQDFANEYDSPFKRPTIARSRSFSALSTLRREVSKAGASSPVSAAAASHGMFSPEAHSAGSGVLFTSPSTMRMRKIIEHLTPSTSPFEEESEEEEKAVEEEERGKLTLL